MKTVQFQDLDRQEVSIQRSSLATRNAFRIYISGPDIKESNDGLGNKIPVALHISEEQAQILINGLKDFLEEDN